MTKQASSFSSDLQPQLVGLRRLQAIDGQTATAMNATVCAPGFAVCSGHHSLTVQLRPGYLLHALTANILSQYPNLEPGMLNTDGDVGQLVLHGTNAADLDSAEEQILAFCQLDVAPQNDIQVVNLGLLPKLTDRHVLLLNRGRSGDLLVTGDSLLQLQVTPAMAVFEVTQQLACHAAQVKLVKINPAGAAGQISLAGDGALLAGISAMFEAG